MSKGRRPKLNNNVIKTFIKAISKGATYRMACGASNIDDTTLCGWFNDAKLIKKAINEGKTLEDVTNIEIADKQVTITNCLNKIKLVESIEKAESTYFQSKLDTINTAADKDWNAAKWILERRCRKDFAPTNTVNVGNVEGETFKQEVHTKTMEEQFLEFEQKIAHLKLGDPKAPPKNE